MLRQVSYASYNVYKLATHVAKRLLASKSWCRYFVEAFVIEIDSYLCLMQTGFEKEKLQGLLVLFSLCSIYAEIDGEMDHDQSHRSLPLLLGRPHY